MADFINVADLKNPASGKTYREENLAKQHAIPLGALVEVQFRQWFCGGACWKVHARLWVVKHDRDCDGTPLYALSRWKDFEFAKQVNQLHCGFGEESLTLVEITPELIDGVGSLEWPDAKPTE